MESLKRNTSFIFENWAPNHTPCLYSLLLSRLILVFTFVKERIPIYFQFVYDFNVGCWNAQRRLLFHSLYYIRIPMTVWNYFNSCKWLEAAKTYHSSQYLKLCFRHSEGNPKLPITNRTETKEKLGKAAHVTPLPSGGSSPTREEVFQ